MGADKWLTYLNSIALFGLITALAFINLDLPALSFEAPVFVKRILQRKEVETEALAVFNLADHYRQGCPDHKFDSVMHVSRTPPIMLIEGFLTQAEADFLVQLGNPLFQDSLVVDYGNSSVTVDKSHRSSQTAYFDIPANPPVTDGDVVLSCIEERAARFQGHIPVDNMESLQVVKYTDSQEFRAHFDWFDPQVGDFDLGPSGNRASSFFVYLVADCFGGTTVFPEVSRPAAAEWCGVLQCHDDEGKEVEWLEVRPKIGTAIFWYHLDPVSGEGDRKTLHAGMPVINGTKVGLNIFTRQMQYRNLES